ncbi:MAG: hypothetical protein OQJ81_05505 [Melioribacteraceae bacterium]|nr:hypothetical protein [Melioribacteraceae bacterium]
MNYSKKAIKSLIEDIEEFNLQLENIQNILRFKINSEISDQINPLKEVSKLKELQAKLIRINDVY